MYVGSLREVVLNEASKNKKKKLSDYDKLIKYNRKVYGGDTDNERFDRVSSATGSMAGFAMGGIPGAAIGAGAGYLAPKAVRKASKWLINNQNGKIIHKDIIK